MKKLINRPEDIVDEMLDGLVAAHPDRLRRVDQSRVLVRQNAPEPGKVGVVTGGGSGHEPAASGFVGEGMLDGVVMGDVFTAPPADQVATLLEACDGGAGVLAIVGNYQGDIMNFEAGIELAEADGDLRVSKTVSADDVATMDTERGARSTTGMIFVQKVAGAKAARGSTLEEVQRAATKANDNVATMGVGLTSCTPINREEPMFDLPEDRIEFGIGLHGEKGLERTEMTDASGITDRLTDEIFGHLDVGPGDRVATIVNGMGATSLAELYIVNRELHERLTEREINVRHSRVGEYTTSADMEGCSVTVMKLDDELEALVTHPSSAPEFRTG
jgi:dihydroxyacetone kinase-like protein